MKHFSNTFMICTIQQCLTAYFSVIFACSTAFIHVTAILSFTLTEEINNEVTEGTFWQHLSDN
jgi:hypothetical protein